MTNLLEREHYATEIWFIKTCINYTVLGNDIISSIDVKERPEKKRTPCITSCFHKGSVPQQDQVCTVPEVNQGGKLFGKELTSICQGGKLPTVILVGLTWFIDGSSKENLIT